MQGQFYFLHIPKTAGSSLTRLLEDSWPAGAMAPQRFVDELGDLSRDELGRYDLVAGHHGVLPIVERSVVITVLRDPAERAWSQYRAYGRLDGYLRGRRVPRFDSFNAFLDDPVYRWMTSDFQARWLGMPPDEPVVDRPHWLPPGAVEWEDGDLERLAMATLRRCSLVGTTERLDDFIEALGRLVGRPMAVPPRLNAAPRAEPMPAEYAELVRARSAVDIRLHAEADQALDRALTTLPALPPEPTVELPYEYDMSLPLDGSGWHARTHTPDTGWHRWTGPGTRSELRLPVRLAGAARLDVAIASACDDEAIRSLRVSVQERPVTHRLEPRSQGVSAVADVELDPGRPLTVALETAHTKHLVDSATGERSSDPAGIAVGVLAFSR